MAASPSLPYLQVISVSELAGRMMMLRGRCPWIGKEVVGEGSMYMKPTERVSSNVAGLIFHPGVLLDIGISHSCKGEDGGVVW